MQISWLGHACFVLVSNQGTRIVTDPFDADMYKGHLNYQPIDISADIVTISHSTHDDHNYARGVRDRRLVKTKAKETVIDDVKIRGVESYHDQSSGRERGPNTIFVFDIDGLVVVHLGDLGHVLEQMHVAAIGPKVDVLLCPVGGAVTVDLIEAGQTIDKLNPRIVIPMHFKTPDCRIGFDDVEPFLANRERVKRLPYTVAINPADLPEQMEVWVMDYRKEKDPVP